MTNQTPNAVNQVALKLLPQSNVLQQLFSLFPGTDSVLDACAGALTEDRNLAYLSQIVRGGKETFFLSTPRYRLRFFEDRNDSTVAVLLSVEANTYFQWSEDKQRGVPCPVSWTARPSGRTTMSVNPHFEKLRSSKSNGISSGRYWDFWSGLLDQEQERLEDLKGHPGWSYSSRRPSMNGGIEFLVDDDRDTILHACGNSFLVQAKKSITKMNGAREKAWVFETQRSETSRWLSGACQRDLDLGSIPKSGIISVNWIGTAAEIKRKREALGRLNAGKAALPVLAELLPDGPSDSLPMPEFRRILSTEYNGEQIDAIRKALVPLTLTSILGPPGTGKTSVIAEIAAQYASQGKRVLISSQSNLAVDNALEKVTDISQIFAVRIGRPESVKLNPELLLEKASQRYRDRLLQRSNEEQEAMHQTISDQKNWLPDEQTLSYWIDCWIHHRERMRQESEAKQALERTKQLSERTAFEMAAAERRLQSLCVIANLSISECDRFLSAGRTLVHLGVGTDMAYRNRAKINLTVKHRDDLERLIRLSRELTDLSQSIAAVKTSISTFQNQISDWNSAKEYLERARRENSSFETKKSNAGFFGTIWMNLTGPPHDMTKVEGRFAEASRLRDSAAQQLPEAQKALEMLVRTLATKVSEQMVVANNTFGTTGAISAAMVEEWQRDLDLAAKVQQAGAFEFISLFDRYGELECAMESLRQATSSSKHVKDDYQRAELAWHKASRDLNASKSFHEDLTAIAERLSVIPPEGLADSPAGQENRDIDAFFSLLRKKRNDVALKIQSWPQVCEALDAYRSRLRQPVVDLQRAVVNDANVVGATCSGIAGNRDFEVDFDCVIVDEAGRTTPLDLIMPIVRGATVVLVGDYKQLPPFIGEEIKEEVRDLERDLLDRSIFQRIYESSHPDRRQPLRTQYRMVEPISEIVREISYTDSDLNCAESLKSRRHSIPELKAVHWIRPIGPDNNAVESVGRGLLNEAEIKAVLYALKRIASHKSGPDQYSIGVISMYKQQALEIERRIASASHELRSVHVEVGTVDSFQGREKDAVILSFAETDPQRRRFFYDRRRLNVAISRAKELLVIVGSLDKLGAKRRAFGIDNPIFELRSMLEDGLGYCYSKEDFNA